METDKADSKKDFQNPIGIKYLLKSFLAEKSIKNATTAIDILVASAMPTVSQQRDNSQLSKILIITPIMPLRIGVVVS